MFGPNNSSAVATRPAPVNTGPSGWFGPGNPATGVLPTLLDADFMNGLLAELLAILAAAGITPSAAQTNQLLQAIEMIVQLVGDARYLQPGGVTGFLKLTGGAMTGPLSTAGLNATGGATTVATPAAGDNSQAAVNSAWVQARLAALVNGETGALATLQGLAAALNQDGNFANDVLAAIASKLGLGGGTLTGILNLVTPPANDYGSAAVNSFWVRALGLAFADNVGHSTAGTVNLTAADMGKSHIAYAPRQVNFVLPDAATVIRMQCICLQGNNTCPITIAPNTGSYIEGFPAPITLSPGGSAVLACYAGNSNAGWFVVSVSDPQTLAGKLNRVGDTATGLSVPTGVQGAGGASAASQAYADTSAATAAGGALSQANNTAAAGDAGKVNRSGDTMAGALGLPAPPAFTRDGRAARMADLPTGGSYGTVNGWSSTQQLPAAACGTLNVIFGSPTLTFPLANSVPSGTPIDFLAAGGAPTLQHAGSDYLNDGTAAGSTYAMTPGTKVRFVSDGGVNWWMDMEGSLAGPTFRSAITAPGVVSTGAVTAAPGAGLILGGLSVVNADGAGNVGINAAAGAGISLRSGAATLLEIDSDGFARLDTALGRTENSSRAARTDWVRSLGRFFAGQSSYGANPNGSAFPTTDCGKCVLAFYTGTTALPTAGLIQGDTMTVKSMSGTLTLTPGNNFAFYFATLGNQSSIALPQGWVLECEFDGGSTWHVVRYGPENGSGKIQPLPGYPFNIGAGTQSYDLVWPAGAYDRLILAISTYVATSGTLIISAFRDGSLNWNNANLALGSTSSGGPTGLLISGANTNLPIVLAAGTGAGTGLPALTGGMSGVRLASMNTSSTYSANGVNLAGT